MFGKNPVERDELRKSGNELRIVQSSPFYTIQGEGPYAGQPAVFLRLHGCPLRCYFCDTEFSQPTDPVLAVDVIMELCNHVAPTHCRLLVITGGEPVRQNLSVFVPMMIRNGWNIQVETSGILWQDALFDCTVVVSPKTPRIHPLVWQHAHAFKYVIKEGEVDCTDGLPVTSTQVEGGKPERLARPRLGVPVYLSPMDEYDLAANQANRYAVAREALAHGYHAGLQLHKFMDLP